MSLRSSMLAKAKMLRLGSRQRIHFLHIGKTAGTQIRHIMRQINERSPKYQLVPHGHRARLEDLPEGAPYFFSIRDPISRFRSGFYSRKRKGQPRLLVEWSSGEKRAFEQFEHANDLAEAIFEDSDRGRSAFCAMRSIMHVGLHQHSSFGLRGDFLTTQPPLHIIRQEHFSQDMADFMRALGVEPDTITTSEVAAHRNDYRDTPKFSELAIRNLSIWYAADLELYKMCVAHLEQKKRSAT